LAATQQVRRLSRVPSEPPHRLHGADEWGAATSSDVHLTGVVCLTLWRLMREELKLGSYTLENVAAHVLNKRLPHVAKPPDTPSPSQHLLGCRRDAPHSFPCGRSRARAVPCQVPAHVLCGWWGSSLADRARAVRTLLGRCDAALAILEKLDLLNRYAESARLYGIPFFDVVSRGSQYRVEAVLMRVMKPLG
jgi:DNA polymerase zeta